MRTDEKRVLATIAILCIVVSWIALGGLYMVTSPPLTASIEDEVFSAINERRNQEELQTLTRSSILDAAAKNWSLELILNNYPESTHSVYNTYPEILAGTIDPISAMFPSFIPTDLVSYWIQAWYESPGHKAVMMYNSGGQMGVGVMRDHGYFIVTVDFMFSS